MTAPGGIFVRDEGVRTPIQLVVWDRDGNQTTIDVTNYAIGIARDLMAAIAKRVDQ